MRTFFLMCYCFSISLSLFSMNNNMNQDQQKRLGFLIQVGAFNSNIIAVTGNKGIDTYKLKKIFSAINSGFEQEIKKESYFNDQEKYVFNASELENIFNDSELTKKEVHEIINKAVLTGIGIGLIPMLTYVSFKGVEWLLKEKK